MCIRVSQMEDDGTEEVVLAWAWSISNRVGSRGRIYLPSASRSSARNLSNTTPGSSGLKKVEPLLALACATEETPMYMTRAFINDRL